MTIKEYRKAMSKLEVVELDGARYIWLCPHCHKQMILNNEQVRRMIYHPDETILCDACKELALFVVKRNEKYLTLNKISENSYAKRWTILGNATIFNEFQIKEYENSYETIQISGKVKDASFEEYLNLLKEEN